MQGKEVERQWKVKERHRAHRSLERFAGLLTRSCQNEVHLEGGTKEMARQVS